MHIDDKEFVGLRSLSELVFQDGSEVVDTGDYIANLGYEPLFDHSPLIRSPKLLHHHLQELRLENLAPCSIIQLLSEDFTEVREAISSLEEATTVYHLDSDETLLTNGALAADVAIDPVEGIVKLLIY